MFHRTQVILMLLALINSDIISSSVRSTIVRGVLAFSSSGVGGTTKKYRTTATTISRSTSVLVPSKWRGLHTTTPLSRKYRQQQLHSLNSNNVLNHRNWYGSRRVAATNPVTLQKQQQQCCQLQQQNRPQQRQRSSELRMVSQQLHVPNFCSTCGSDDMVVRIPDGDERPRACCNACDAVVYVNPKVVVSCVILRRNNDTGNVDVLLGKRSIEPRLGFWGIPQGYLELGETSREGAVREAYEEVGIVLDPKDLALQALYNVPGTVQIVYKAYVEDDDYTIPDAGSTIESSEIDFFHISKLPELCFPTVEWAIDYCSTNNGGSKVQQKTKLYDPDTNVWSEMEDEA